jgi:NAD-dependent dihydropyrimidine dehydrogenase PreA subunit
MERCVLVCACVRSGLIESRKLETVLSSLQAAGRRFEVVPDLCELAAEKGSSASPLGGRSPGAIVACYPRAVKALLNFAGLRQTTESCRCLDLRENSPQEILEALAVPVVQAQAPHRVPQPERGASAWIPWFPVIDYDRCVHCQQCLGFCLFGVYGLDETGQVQVVDPRACKTNCPACARICPHVAIIFPKYAPGVIAGAEVRDAELEQNRAQADRRKLLGSRAYQTLAERRRKGRERRLLKGDLALAEQERLQHLTPSAQPTSASAPRSEEGTAAAEEGAVTL